MRVTFVGLSCFVVENATGHRLVLDPFNDAPDLSLGVRFPERLDGAPFGANLVLMSEPDADHSRAPGPWLRDAPVRTAPGEDAFPGFDVRGTIIHEWDGDLNIAWHCTVDGLRLLHLADLAHVLTPAQLAELGRPDVVFHPGPKVAPETPEGVAALGIARANITALRPRLVVWSHHLAPPDVPAGRDPAVLRPYFVEFFRAHAATSQYYREPESFIQLCHVLEGAALLTAEAGGEELRSPTLDVTPALLARGEGRPLHLLFRSMVAEPM